MIRSLPTQIALCEHNQGVGPVEGSPGGISSRPDVDSLTSRDSAESPSPPCRWVHPPPPAIRGIVARALGAVSGQEAAAVHLGAA
jgi:hypothetical protein